MSLFSALKNIGTKKNDPLELKRRREFFNVIVALGILTSIPNAIYAFSFDAIAGYLHIAWGIIGVLAIISHHYISFKVARFVAYLSILLLAGLASSRLGHASYNHIPSFSVLISIFITYDLKREWRWITFYVVIQMLMIFIIETDILRSTTAPNAADASIRITNFFAAIIFVSIELSFFIQMTKDNEQEVNQQLRNANQELIMRHAEKDILLKEVHHRVKNNLQIISSLLKLQSYEVKDDDSRLKFADSVNRVQSISKLHEKIYKSENLMKIDLEKYLLSIGKNLIESYGINNPIEFRITSDLPNVQNDLIVPISLILNEFISNSLKHGFSKGDPGVITVEIAKNGISSYQLMYTDNGTWKENGSINSEESFGIELVHTLIEQINGEIVKVPSQRSSTYLIQFNMD